MPGSKFMPRLLMRIPQDFDFPPGQLPICLATFFWNSAQLVAKLFGMIEG